MMNQVANNKTTHVKSSDLPLSCPTKDMATWNQHPKVYLDMSKTGEATCQYCGAHYILDSEK
jgi:uncharacterized Zn-finger protein